MRRWFTFPIGAVEWRVYVASERELARMKHPDVEGFCDYRDGCIYINRTFTGDQKRAEEIATHEIEHAILYVSGAGHACLKQDENEETHVRMTSPLRHDAMTRGGLMRFPKVPR